MLLIANWSVRLPHGFGLGVDCVAAIVRLLQATDCLQYPSNAVVGGVVVAVVGLQVVLVVVEVVPSAEGIGYIAIEGPVGEVNVVEGNLG